MRRDLTSRGVTWFAGVVIGAFFSTMLGGIVTVLVFREKFYDLPFQYQVFLTVIYFVIVTIVAGIVTSLLRRPKKKIEVRLV